METNIERYYPQEFKLHSVQVLHRHGHRSALRARLPNIIPPSWRKCFESNILFHNFLAKSIEAHSGNEKHTVDHPSHERGLSKNIGSSLLPLTGSLFRLSYEMPTIEVDSLAGMCYFGQLTDIGRNTMKNFGTSLRDLYISKLKFLPYNFDPKNVYLRSSEYARTIESLQCVFTGLYPAVQVPVTLNIRKEQDETLFPSSKCPRLKQLEAQFRQIYLRDYEDRISAIKKRLSHLFSTPDQFGNLPSVHGLFDSIYAARENKVVPDFISQNDLDELEKLSAAEWFSIFKKSKESSRLGIGKLISEIKQVFVNKLENLNTDPVKLAIYSGHDTTIAPLLAAFDLLRDEWPPFASNVILELIENTVEKEKQSHQNFYVRMRYNGNFTQIPGCQSPISGQPEVCPVQQFFKICDTLIPVNYMAECAIENKSK